ncbi:MAG: hypothetical protein KF709_05860 [Gemmatimonadaceae bacterium]|nr:hypothetical protein [Gemmatimonadaceae bacterium]
MKIRSFVAWTTRQGDLSVRVVPRGVEREQTLASEVVAILNDASEFDAQAPDTCLAAGVPLRLEPAGDRLVLHTSLVALPPVFIFESDAVVALASDVASLRRVPGVRLRFDPVGVAQLGAVGHPIQHRSLFEGLRLAPAGARLTLDAQGRVATSAAWELPAARAVSSDELLAAQESAFREAVERIDVSTSVLSLTAGLDTRAVFSSLAAAGRLVPGCTITGPRPSLDARVAATLCRHYGVAHTAIEIGDAFERDLPSLMDRASLLSGGLESLGQAPEVYLYDVLAGRFGARLSGNLGNQIGRGGTEGVSVRGADLEVLGPALRTESTTSSSHWLIDQLDAGPREAITFILQQEIPSTLVGNFSVGSHFAVQQTPYASRALIDTLAQRAAAMHDVASRSALRLRLRDLRHRFFGEPASRSFQRRLVAQIGGFAAEYPINWGWRPTGGVSLPGMAWGAATLVGMYARARGLDDGALRSVMRTTGLPALHDFRESRRWLRVTLREYLRDLVGSQRIREAGLFDTARLTAALDAYAAGAAGHYATITFALDVALAHRNFVETA